MSIQPNQQKFITTHQNPYGLQLLTIGFCKDLAGEQRLIAAGVEPFMIWRLGDGTCSALEDALYAFRDRGGCLAIVDDFRIFGDGRKKILAMVSKLTRETATKGPIKIVNVDQPDKDNYQLIDQAVAMCHAAKPMPNHRVARYRGRQGGKAKAAAAALARAMRIDPEIARRLWSLKELTQKTKLWVLGEGFTLSSCQRHFT